MPLLLCVYADEMILLKQGECKLCGIVIRVREACIDYADVQNLYIIRRDETVYSQHELLRIIRRICDAA